MCTSINMIELYVNFDQLMNYGLLGLYQSESISYIFNFW